MRIEVSQMYQCFFTYEGTEIMIPVRAQSEEEAKTKLRQFLLLWGNELVLSTPTISPIQQTQVPEVPTVSPMMLELRIEQLVKELMPIKKPSGAQSMEKLVKSWTGFPYESSNYQAIISELEKIKAGQ